MTKTSGTLTQKITMSFDINTLLENIAEIIHEQVDNALDSIVDDHELDESYTIEDGQIIIEGNYKTSYTSTGYPATLTDPPEYDFSRTIDCLDADTIMKHIRDNILPKHINSSDIMKNITLDIDESEDDVTYDEYEPDWDSMPGGHDYY